MQTIIPHRVLRTREQDGVCQILKVYKLVGTRVCSEYAFLNSVMNNDKLASCTHLLWFLCHFFSDNLVAKSEGLLLERACIREYTVCKHLQQ